MATGSRKIRKGANKNAGSGATVKPHQMNQCQGFRHATQSHGSHQVLIRAETTIKHALKKLTTPAMEAGIADHVWNIDDIISLLD
jgi:hypothetical protein